MSPVGVPLLVAFLSTILLPFSATAEPELWICKRADGSTMFTNQAPTQAGCSTYSVRSELGYLKRAAEPPAVKQEAPTLPEPKVQAQTAPPPITINIVISSPPPTPPPIQTLAPVGEISFETYRMLSVGMTEAEVLGRAGLPQTTNIGSAYSFGSPYPFWPIFGANRFVYSSGDWIVELTFGGGRVLSINQTRLRP
ncbi:MAG TPA: hypothetical protein VE201_01980 [Nitrospirales bacterium]|nr:hypothetical protein [Nitrospirales bacterium]